MAWQYTVLHKVKAILYLMSRLLPVSFLFQFFHEIDCQQKPGEANTKTCCYIAWVMNP